MYKIWAEEQGRISLQWRRLSKPAVFNHTFSDLVLAYTNWLKGGNQTHCSVHPWILSSPISQVRIALTIHQSAATAATCNMCCTGRNSVTSPSEVQRFINLLPAWSNLIWLLWPPCCEEIVGFRNFPSSKDQAEYSELLGYGALSTQLHRDHLSPLASKRCHRFYVRLLSSDAFELVTSSSSILHKALQVLRVFFSPPNCLFTCHNLWAFFIWAVFPFLNTDPLLVIASTYYWAFKWFYWIYVFLIAMQNLPKLLTQLFWEASRFHSS